MSENIDEQYRQAFLKVKHSFQQSDWDGFEKAYLGNRRRPFLWALPLGLVLIFSSFLNGDNYDLSTNYISRSSIPNAVVIPAKYPSELAMNKSLNSKNSNAKPPKTESLENAVLVEKTNEITEKINRSQLEKPALNTEKLADLESNFEKEKLLNPVPIVMEAEAQTKESQLFTAVEPSLAQKLTPAASVPYDEVVLDLMNSPFTTLGFIDCLRPISNSEKSILEPILPEFKAKKLHWGLAFYSSGFLAFGSKEISETMTSQNFLSRELGILAMVDKNAWSAELGLGQRSIQSSAWLSEKVSWIETSINIVSNRSIQGIDSIPKSHKVGLIQQGSNSYFGITSTDLSYDTTYAIVQDTLITQQELDSTRQGRMDFQISYIEFPFMLNHDFKTGPLRLQVNAGLVANLLTGQKIESQSLALEQSYKAEVAKSYLQGMAGLSVVGDLNTNWTVRLSGLMRKDLSASTSETPEAAPLRKMNYGLRLSLRYSPY